MAPKNKTKTKTLPPADTQTKTLTPTKTKTLPPTQTETLPPTKPKTLTPSKTKTLPSTQTETLPSTQTETLPPKNKALAPTPTKTLTPTKAKNLALAKIKTLFPTKSLSSSEEYEEPKTPVKTPTTSESSSDDTGSSSSGIQQPKNLKVSFKTPERKASCSNVGVEKQVVLEEKEEPDKNDSKGKKDKRVTRSQQKPESTKIAESYSEDSDVKKEVPKKGKIDTRVWSEEDEIKVLEWVITCKTEGIPPTSDKEGFNKFMGKVYEKRQLSDKIYKMKQKFLKFVGSWEKEGSDSLYENTFYGLGKQIWESEMISTGRSDKKGKKPKEDEDEKAKRVSMGKRKVSDSGEKEGESKTAKMEISQEEFWKKYPLLRESIQTYSSLLFGNEKMSSVFHHGTKLGHKWAQDMESQWSLYAEKEKEMKSLELEVFMDGIKEEMEIDIAETN